MKHDGNEAHWLKLLKRFDQLPGSARVGTLQLAALAGVHRQTVWRWLRAGKIPPPKVSPINGRRTWSKFDVLQILEGKQ